jgi:hypothetical protein
MSVLRLARLALLSQQQQSSASLALQHLLPAAACAQHRLYQAAAVSQASNEDAGADDQQLGTSQQYMRAAADRPQEHAWSPQRSLPPATHYGVKVTIKAHDLKFLKLASTVIRDLMLVHFAPKSNEVLPPGWKKGDTGVRYVNLASVATLWSPGSGRSSRSSSSSSCCVC